MPGDEAQRSSTIDTRDEAQPSSTANDGWTWDPTLYAGSAPFYPVGRVAYPRELAERLAAFLDLHGSRRGLSARLLDVGCGPGSLTLLLAPWFADVVGVGADPDMLAEADRQAGRAGVENVAWRHLRAEDLPADLPAPTVVTFAQSFHWMDQPRVATAVRALLVGGGVVVHVGATTHEGMDTDERLEHPRPPRDAIRALVRRHLGEGRRAGRSVLPADVPPGHEDDVFRAAGFEGPEQLELRSRDVTRSAEEVRASVYSLSVAAPRLFGSSLDTFDAELRALIDQGSPDGVFSERLRGITVSVWR